MPRSSGGRGKSSSASSGSGNTKKAAALLGLSAANKSLANTFVVDRSICQIIYTDYEACMSPDATNRGVTNCDNARKQMDLCSGFKMGPRDRSVVERRRKDVVESVQSRATAAGFTDVKEYLRHKSETDPGLCRVAYKLYNQCICENKGARCNRYRNNCPQFKN